MKRYNAVVGGVYDNSVMVEERDGDWVWYEDVEDVLEALQDAIALYGKFGAIVNDPHNAGEWITKAQEAVRRATE